ncbi:MAG TPA: DinB family protein [Vicinamibacteria bacterium]|jgi:hypothetical protein
MHGELSLRLVRLERSRVRALALIEGKDGVQLNRPPAPGKWSALQVLHHVVTAEALTLAYIRKKQQAGAALPAASVASRLRLLLVEVALASPLRVRAPAVTADVPQQLDADGLRARWDDVRRELAALVEAFPNEFIDRLVFRHPYAGRMTLAHALGTLEAHLEHHVRQVERALSVLA